MFRSTAGAVCLFILPLLAFASVIAQPEKASTVLDIIATEVPQEFFGRLTNFPHTFDFTVKEPFEFTATVFVHDDAEQKNDVSIILVKKERRGVSEIGRTSSKQDAWQAEYDAVLAESFRKGGVLTAELQEGSYTLEVSSPNNEGVYRLRLGDDVDRGYFENIQALFEVKKLINASPLSALLSPLLYVPFVLLLFGVLSIFLFKRKQ